MKLSRVLMSNLFVVVVFSLLLPISASGQKHDRSTSNQRQYSSQGRSSTNRNASRERDRHDRVYRLDRSVFEDSCYKLGAAFNDRTEPLNFAVSGLQWDQVDGPGSQLTITYSYSNLLEGGMRGLTTDQLKLAVEESLSLWASEAPLNFVEIEDVGPDPTAADASYAVGNSADIRIGAHVIDGPNGAQLAHAFVPFSTTDGIAGDLHFDIEEDWSLSSGGVFLETALHELGHCLGLDHEENVDAIMNPFLGGRFSGLGTGFLLTDDIAGIQAIYGSGTGSVTPLVADPNDEPNVDPTDVNDVIAELDSGGMLTVTGDSLDNSLLVYSSSWLTVVWGYNETTINGQRGDFWFTRGQKSVNITTGDGSDTVILYGVSAESATVDLGAGDDTLAILFSRITAVTAEPGDGTDRILTWFSRIGELVETGFETVW